MNPSPIIHLVDDEPDLCRAIGRLLVTEGYGVRTYSDGEAFLRSVDPDSDGCVLLDIAMPGIDGLETQRRMLHSGIRMPIVFLTAHGGTPESLKARAAGAIEILPKPVRREDLLRAIGAALDATARERDGPLERP